MAAVEVLESDAFDVSRVVLPLRLVPNRPDFQPLRRGPSLRQRRAVRARQLHRRHRALAIAVLVGALVVLAVPGHVFGATTGAGLSTDLANASVLASGMEYVVQPGDTVNLIARDMNPTDPSLARKLLVDELGSAVIVPGEHVVIP